MSEVDAQIARLTALLESWQREFGRRMDKQDEQLTLIVREVRETNGRVTRHDGKIEALEKAAVVVQPYKPAEDSKLRDELKWYLACAGGGAGVVLWVLKVIGKL